jgi:hypothetical protein
MFRWGRKPLPSFEGNERLYVRFNPHTGYQEGTSNTTFEAALREQLRLPEWSANRSLFSKPQDVLFPSWCSWGVWSHVVDDLPTDVTNNTGAVFDLSPEHAPEPDNYGHTNVVLRKDGTRMTQKPKPGVKNKLLESLVNCASGEFLPPLARTNLAWFRRRIMW